MSPGQRFGRYQIVRQLGRGAMGEVYLATDTESNRQIALKVVYKGTDSDDQEILDAERLGAELQKRVCVIDSRVCRVNRYGEISGDLFIEMEYIEGEDLSAILSRQPLAPGMAVRAGIELCEMLEQLKAFTTEIDGKQFHGVIHGDLKPKNIRLNPQNQVKVLDFGISKALSYTRKSTLSVFASTAYCSPERLETQSMDSHSDLWAVGVLLYQMISGRLPFEEPNNERLERRIRSYSAPNPLPATVPEPLRSIIGKTLARNPGERYQSAAELREDLQRFERGEPVEAKIIESDGTTRTTPGGRTAPADDRTVRTSAPLMPKTAASARRSRMSSFAFGCLLLIGASIVMGSTFGLLQVSVWNAAEQLKSDVKSGRVDNLDVAWSRYQALTNRMHLPGTLRGARLALKGELVDIADHPIREYRESEAPQVFQKQWTDSRAALSRALELDPDDKTLKGKLLVCEAHLDRINAGRASSQTRQKLLNSAEQKFEEAAELLKESPDPYLGLARLYVYDMNDIDKAEEALNKAVDYGHPMGRRETAQLADGYRRRADRTWRDSRAVIDIPQQERDYLNKARQDYLKAEELYRETGLFGDAPRSEMQAMQGQQRVEQRLSQLEMARTQGVATQ